MNFSQKCPRYFCPCTRLITKPPRLMKNIVGERYSQAFQQRYLQMAPEEVLSASLGHPDGPRGGGKKLAEREGCFLGDGTKQHDQNRKYPAW